MIPPLFTLLNKRKEKFTEVLSQRNSTKISAESSIQEEEANTTSLHQVVKQSEVLIRKERNFSGLTLTIQKSSRI